MSKSCFGKGRMPKKGITILIGTGILLHAILISSIFAFVYQKINATTLDIIQAFNASTIVIVPWLSDRYLRISDQRLS
jgi:hypothetical protein